MKPVGAWYRVPALLSAAIGSLFIHPGRTAEPEPAVPVAAQPVVANVNRLVEALQSRVPVTRSSWIALRQFPQLHTNPVNVRVGDAPIRASRRSARWCLVTIERLREQRREALRAPERAAAMQAYDEAVEKFRQRAGEAPEGS